MKLIGRIQPSAWPQALRSAFGSLKLRITLGVIASLTVGIGLSTALLVRQAERDTLTTQRDRELGEVSRTAGLLSQRVAERQVALQAVAAQLDAGTLHDPARLAAFIESKPVLRGMFTTVFAASADGTLRALADASTVRHPKLDLADREYFQRALKERRPVVSEPFHTRTTGKPAIAFAVPLYNAGTTYGVLAGGLQLEARDVLDDLIGRVGPHDHALHIVTDLSGRILAHPSHARVMGMLADEQRLSSAFASWVAAGRPAEPTGLDLAQPGELATAAAVPSAGWVVWRASPQAELLAPLRAARREAMAWAVGLIAALSLVSLLFLRLFLRPLTQLEHRAEHLFDSAHDPHAGWPGASGELGRLERVLRHVGAERARLEHANTAALQKLGSVMSAAPVGIAFTRNQRFELVSAEFCRLAGRAEHELVGQLAQIIYPNADDFEVIGAEALKAFAAGEPYVGEWELQRADGTRFWARLRGRPVEVGDPKAGAIWTLNDIGEQIAARERLEWSATHDALTGLANRKMLDQRLAAVFAALPRSVPAALIMIDLDHFKPINDSAGHAAGDAMLQAVATAIGARVRASDLVVRLGGDEFGLVLERCTPEVALRIADDVRRAVAELVLPWSDRELRVGASVGVAMLAVETRDAAAWMAAADSACYEAKAQGRDRVCSAVRPLLQVSDEDTAAIEP